MFHVSSLSLLILAMAFVYFSTSRFCIWFWDSLRLCFFLCILCFFFIKCDLCFKFLNDWLILWCFLSTVCLFFLNFVQNILNFCSLFPFQSFILFSLFFEAFFQFNDFLSQISTRSFKLLNLACQILNFFILILLSFVFLSFPSQ